jgi:hypothetical protein
MITDQDVAALKQWAAGNDDHRRAAVGLLIEHDHWLWNDEFAERCVRRFADGTVYLDFAEIERFWHDGCACSESEAAMLRVIADIGSGRWRISVMDVRNRDRLIRAVTVAAGLDR